jgi:hypothetical protein
MRSPLHTKQAGRATQLTLVSTPEVVKDAIAPAAVRRRPRARMGRNERMADRLDTIAIQAERDAADAVMAHDDVTARELLERAQAARRAASLLRAGPSGVRDLLAS